MQIVFDHICTYGGLRDFSLELQAEGCISLYDPSEKLSASLLSTLVGLEDICGGKLSLDGIDYADYWQNHQLLETFGYVFDEGIMLSNLTLKENLLLPWRKRFDNESDKLFETELQNWLSRLDLNLDINLRPALVSAAERKFMGFVRALMLKPRLLLIDDPYYLLNKGERQKLNGFLRELKRNVNLLIASADDDFIIGFASRVISLQDVSPA